MELTSLKLRRLPELSPIGKLEFSAARYALAASGLGAQDRPRIGRLLSCGHIERHWAALAVSCQLSALNQYRGRVICAQCE